ncbi:MAG TPA: hypothetical protein VGB30_08745 [bacterium]|jgi:hypothetical protein
MKLEDNKVSDVSLSVYPWHWVAAVGVFALGFILQLPNRVTVVYDWDNVQYLLALEKFDLLARRPTLLKRRCQRLYGW